MHFYFCKKEKTTKRSKWGKLRVYFLHNLLIDRIFSIIAIELLSFTNKTNAKNNDFCCFFFLWWSKRQKIDTFHCKDFLSLHYCVYYVQFSDIRIYWFFYRSILQSQKQARSLETRLITFALVLCFGYNNAAYTYMYINITDVKAREKTNKSIH